ncbi:MAG: lysophospholipid acyltransferase family protein [Promethearchaeota archaeon]
MSSRQAEVVRRILNGFVRVGLRGAVIRAMAWVYYLYFKLKVNLKVFGLRNLPRPPFILVGNHSSGADAHIALAIMTGRMNTRLYFVVHERAFRKETVEKVVLEFLEARPRHGSGQQVVQTMARWLREGKVVIIPPEGMYNREGKIMKGYTGVVRLYYEANRGRRPHAVPIVPACTIGADKAFSPWADEDGRYHKRRVGVVVRVGEPIFLPEKQDGELTHEYLRGQVDAIMDRVAKMALQREGAVDSWKLAGLRPGERREYRA